MAINKHFDPDCHLCPRLSGFLREIKQKYADYHCRPVAPFGDSKARLLIVGLAPGLHGANATGRPFTGDYAGILLYQALHGFGFGSRPVSESADDGLALRGCRITNAVKCLPPKNQPTSDEIGWCNDYLAAELAELPERSVILALGLIAHRAFLKAFGLRPSWMKFAHNAVYCLPNGHVLLDSYHSSRYNVQTGRLTPAMFNDVFLNAVSLLNAGESGKMAIES